MLFEQFLGKFCLVLTPNFECFTKADAFCSHSFDYACLRRLRSYWYEGVRNKGKFLFIQSIVENGWWWGGASSLRSSRTWSRIKADWLGTDPKLEIEIGLQSFSEQILASTHSWTLVRQDFITKIFCFYINIRENNNVTNVTARKHEELCRKRQWRTPSQWEALLL